MSNTSALKTGYFVYWLFSGNMVSSIFGGSLVIWLGLMIGLTFYHPVTEQDKIDIIQTDSRLRSMERSILIDIHYDEPFWNPQWWIDAYPEAHALNMKQKAKQEQWARDNPDVIVNIRKPYERDIKKSQSDLQYTAFTAAKMKYFYEQAPYTAAYIMIGFVVFVIAWGIYIRISTHRITQYDLECMAEVDEVEREIEREDKEERIQEEKVNNKIARKNQRINRGTDYLE